jgi:hypothetical protein
LGQRVRRMEDRKSEHNRFRRMRKRNPRNVLRVCGTARLSHERVHGKHQSSIKHDFASRDFAVVEVDAVPTSSDQRGWKRSLADNSSGVEACHRAKLESSGRAVIAICRSPLAGCSEKRKVPWMCLLSSGLIDQSLGLSVLEYAGDYCSVRRVAV